MEVRQHIGILLLFTIINYIIWFQGKDWEKGYKSYIPLVASMILWSVFEICYYAITLLIL